jgi:hypothetical protein
VLSAVFPPEIIYTITQFLAKEDFKNLKKFDEVFDLYADIRRYNAKFPQIIYLEKFPSELKPFEEKLIEVKGKYDENLNKIKTRARILFPQGGLEGLIAQKIYNVYQYAPDSVSPEIYGNEHLKLISKHLGANVVRLDFSGKFFNWNEKTFLILKDFKNLETLSINPKVYTEKFDLLSKIPKLKNLVFYMSDSITMEQLKFLKKLKRLEELELVGATISNYNLDLIPRNIKRLGLWSTEIKNIKYLAPMVDLKKMKTLSIDIKHLPFPTDPIEMIKYIPGSVTDLHVTPYIWGKDIKSLVEAFLGKLKKLNKLTLELPRDEPFDIVKFLEEAKEIIKKYKFFEYDPATFTFTKKPRPEVPKRIKRPSAKEIMKK